VHAKTPEAGTFQEFGDEIARAPRLPDEEIRVPTKNRLFKNSAKYVMSREVTNEYKGAASGNQGYNRSRSLTL